MPVTNLGRGDPARIVNDLAKRVERMERRQKSGGGSTSGGGIVLAGGFAHLQARGVSGGGGGFGSTGTSDSPFPGPTEIIGWGVTAGNPSIVDVTDTTHGTIVLTTPGLYSVTGSVWFVHPDDHGILLSAGFSLNSTGTVVASQLGGYYETSGGLANPSIAVPVNYSGPLDHMNIYALYNTAPSGDGTHDSYYADLSITALVSN